MQVESVAYAAGRRDVLYAFFYLLCLIFYIFSLDRKKHYTIKYVISMFFALLALLSKGQALTIPITLILISLFMNGKWNSKSFWLDKLPFFLLSAVIAYKVFSAPQYAAVNFTNTSYMDSDIPFLSRIVYACFGFIQYIILLVIPYKLSLVHPYPEIDGKYIIPVFYYLYVILFCGLIYLFFRYTLKKKNIWFGIAFFAVNIFMLLQLIPNSYGIMNDHYVYFAGIGIFIIIAKSVSDKFQNKKYFIPLIFICSIYIIILSFLSFQRIDTFRNSITVWSDVVNKYPQCYMAYNNRGLAYYNKGAFNKAIDDYSEAIDLKPNYAEAFNNRGAAYNDQKIFDKANADLKKAIELNPNYAEAYYNLGNTLGNQGLYFIAVPKYTKAIELNPDNYLAYNNRGIIYNDEGLHDKAISDYTKAIELNPNYFLAYNNRGNIYNDQKMYEKAISDYSKAIELNPENADAYNNLGLAYFKQGFLDNSCQNFVKSAELGSEEAKENVEKFCNGKK